MARPSRPWFRFYVEAVYDRKLRRPPPATRWLWVVLLAVARASPIAGWLMIGERSPATVDDLADIAALRRSEVEAGMAYFEKEGMIELDPVLGAYCVSSFLERQFESDNVTARTRKHRSQEQ